MIPWKRQLGCVVLSAGLLAGGLAWGEDAPSASDQTVPAVSKPSQKRELTLTIRGTISQVPVKEGDTVKQGQLLLAEDDRVEQKELERLQLEAQSQIAIKAAEAELKVKQAELANYEEMFKNHASNEIELRKAQAEAEVALLQVEKAKQDSEIRTKEAEKQAAVLELMRRTSPIDGVIAKLDVGVGEVVDPTKPVCTVVQNNPLWVEAYVPVGVAAQLKVGQKMQVRYPEQEQWQAGEVNFLSPVADERSGMRLIRLQLPNPELRESGLNMLLKLPEQRVAQAGDAASH
ncbi:MAG: efflux RND transporter periplasmic adaptor subunit [Phycisphaerales bacterium]|jgi:RND family efflux transporter MFP subunit|nr:efflux RND transporter periplasmic adaptor subunit [Phycisphaerales bacterium]